MKRIITVLFATGLLAALATGCKEEYKTYSDAEYRCTGRCRIINPMMRPVSFEDRVKTGVRKTGCDPEKV